MDSSATAKLDTAADRQKDGIELQLTDPAPIVFGVGTHLFRINHVIRDHECPGSELRIDEIEAVDIQILPQVDEHKIKRSLEFGQRRESAADMNGHAIGQTRPRERLARISRLVILKFQAYHP